jgi:(p)ppGpp synthase/HD superfamily hydrolase
MDEQVAIARAIATVAHKGQVDQAGVPYIYHPRRVAAKAAVLGNPVQEAAAWLHDVIEDTHLDEDDLRAAGVSQEVLTVVKLLTRRKGQDPAAYYAQIRDNPDALVVKLADIGDNLNRDRMALLPVLLRERLVEKYAKAHAALLLGED